MYMDHSHFNRLMQLLRLTGGKYIIVEDGEPRAVLLSYAEYEELALPHYAGQIAQKLSEDIEKVNEAVTKSQLFDLREEVIVETPPEIRIEPLSGLDLE